MSQTLMGVDLTDDSEDALFELGTRHYDPNTDKEWIYVQADAGGVTGAGYVVLIDEAYAADMVDTTNSGTGYGQILAVSPIAVAASGYFWAQVGGVCVVRVAASAAANVRLNTTATAGQLDDDGTAGAEVAVNIALTTANGGAAATAAAVLIPTPNVGATV